MIVPVLRASGLAASPVGSGSSRLNALLALAAAWTAACFAAFNEAHMRNANRDSGLSPGFIFLKDDTREASRRGDPEATCAVLRTASCETRCHSSHRWAVSQHGKGIVVGAASAQRRQAIGRPDFENTNFGDPEKRRDFEDLLQKQIDMRDYLYKNFW